MKGLQSHIPQLTPDTILQVLQFKPLHPRLKHSNVEIPVNNHHSILLQIEENKPYPHLLITLDFDASIPFKSTEDMIEYVAFKISKAQNELLEN